MKRSGDFRGSPDVARRIEDACLNGWPALEVVTLDTAVLRLSEGHTRRANSVNLLGPLAGDPGAFIRACEVVYARHGLPTIFRLSSAVPGGLDAALDAAGYLPPEDETPVLYRALPNTSAGAGAGISASTDVRLTRDAPEEDWLDALARFQGQSPQVRGIHARILGRLAVPAVFAAARQGDATLAVAFGAVHDGVVCINSVATDPAARRRGLARRTIGAVLAWAVGETGAREACVPVVADNTAAIALYGTLGFDRDVLHYAYRRRPPS